MQQFWDQQLVFDPPSSPIIPSFYPPAEPTPRPSLHPSHHSSLRSLDAVTKESSPSDKKRLAGQRSREKKRNYVKDLEEDVRRLSQEIDQYDAEVSKCKSKLVEALKTTNSTSNEHAYTFEELQRAALSEDPDIDRINLLVDLIRNRIGATGTERQTKLAYYFKQIFNTIFPALYRYLLNTAQNATGLFADHQQEGSEDWTQEQLFKTIDESQREQLCKLRQVMCSMWGETVGHIRRLKAAKEKIKRQGEIFEHQMGIYRADLSPIQVALLMLFAEKNKLRRQLSFSEDFETPIPRKRLKAD